MLRHRRVRLDLDPRLREGIAEVDLCPERLGLDGHAERHREVLFEQGEQSANLFRLTVTIHGGFLDHRRIRRPFRSLAYRKFVTDHGGQDVVDKIGNVQTNSNDRPISPVTIETATVKPI